MIKFEGTEVMGFDHAIRGMRNPMNSWDKMDSKYEEIDYYDWGRQAKHLEFIVGANDIHRMMALAKGGPVHAKYRRMISVYVDITAPLYWWKEFDTYKIGTVSNSCSTMHKIHDKEFTIDDFSHEHLGPDSLSVLQITLDHLNRCRDVLLDTKEKDHWWQMIQLLPSSYNQKRTIMLNYEVLTNIYESRKGHKLDEWGYFCKWVDGLQYSDIITGGK